MANLIVRKPKILSHAGRDYRCAIGRGGLALNKREGDGVTPVGNWRLRRILYRPDRVDKLNSQLPGAPLMPHDGWCDDPAHADYNRQVRLPFEAKCETLWRDDRVYDIVVVLGHNDDPVVPGRGSAIFLHIARENFSPTKGCVALARADLIHILATVHLDDSLEIIG